MNQADYYMNLPFDLSGGRSKNRFRLELLWGVSKMLELMESTDDFTVIFDYVCDIEIHLNERFEFYQVKTHKEGQTKYNSGNLVKIKSREKNSVLGKLFMLNKGEDMPVKLVLVCNTPFKALTEEPGELSFDRLDEKNQKIIIEAIKEELEVENVDLTSLYYLYTPMNLLQPEAEIKGKLITTFECIKGSEPVNPNALYRLVFDTVSEKACYEFPLQDYEQIKKYKGISRAEFDRILEVHSSNEKTGVSQTIEYINQIKSIHEKRRYKDALTTFLPKRARSRNIEELELMMVKTLEEHPEIEEVNDAINLLEEEYHDRFSVEYNNAEKTVCYMIVIHKYAEGGYNDEIDF